MLQMIRWCNFALLAWLAVAANQLPAQITLSHAQPAAIFPVGPTRLTLHGDKFAEPVRVLTSQPLQIEVVEVTPQQVTLNVQPEGGRLCAQSLGLMVATAEAISAPIVLLVDDLPTIAEAKDNHSIITAQTIGPAMAVDAVANGKQLDYFRFYADRGQELTFEVLASQLGSLCDPVVHILQSDGSVLRSIDDDAISPDSRFRHRFAEAGNYLLEVHDNRYRAALRYRIRIGNFPLLQFAYPYYVQRGHKQMLTFAGLDRSTVEPQEVNVPTDAWPDWLAVPTRLTQGGALSNVLVRTTDRPQFQESEPNNHSEQANDIGQARGINGLLEQPGDRDYFQLTANKDQSWRFAGRTRSIGSSTLLKMTLSNSSGEVLGRTTVNDSDEWQFTVKFPADGQYVLAVEDLLGRGGPGHGYHIELGPAAPFALAIKADAKSRDSFALQPNGGAAAIDLTVDRNSHNGPITLQLEPTQAGLTIVNPIIPAGAKETRLYLLANPSWNAQLLSGLRLVGQTQEEPTYHAAVSSQGLHVLRAPHVPFPQPWQDGRLTLAGVADQPAFFELTSPEQPILLPRSLPESSVALSIKRIQAEFKEPIHLVRAELPDQWSASHKLDKDTLTLSIKHPTALESETATLKFWWYGQWNDRGLAVQSDLQFKLYDPLKLTVPALLPVKQGEALKVLVQVSREGGQGHDVTLKLSGLPTGTAAPDSIVVPAAESQVEFTLTASEDASIGKTATLVIEGTTKLGEQEISFSTEPVEVEVLAK